MHIHATTKNGGVKMGCLIIMLTIVYLFIHFSRLADLRHPLCSFLFLVNWLCWFVPSSLKINPQLVYLSVESLLLLQFPASSHNWVLCFAYSGSTNSRLKQKFLTFKH